MSKWKKIPTRTNYSVSDEGQVRNDKTGKILKQSPSTKGYARVSLSNGHGNIPTILFPHRAVAELFIPNPDKLPMVNHRNLDKMDSCKDNLEWVTSKENVKHAIDNGAWDPKEASKKATEASLVINSKPVKVTGSNSEEIQFPSLSAASRELKIPYSSLRRAVQKGTIIKGFKIVK